MGPVTEARRLHLYQTLQREFGDEDAATMMAMLPPPGSVGVATKEDVALLVTKDDATQFATKQDLERFATKQDLERLATKQDLERLATKEDLERFATKQDLERFATKEEVIAAKMEMKDEVYRQTRLFIGWLLLSNATMTAIIGLLVKIG